MAVSREMSYIADLLFIYLISLFNLIRIYSIDYFISSYSMKNDFLKWFLKNKEWLNWILRINQQYFIVVHVHCILYVNTINGALCRELNAHLSRCHGPYTFNLQRRESIVRKKKCTCVVHRGFPNDWLATSSSDRNLQVKIPGENPRWVVFFHTVCWNFMVFGRY